jgi:hypothetical protein
MNYNMRTFGTDSDTCQPEIGCNLDKIEKKIKLEQKKKENPKIKPKQIFGGDYKEPIYKKKKK